ncbi:hypothetical protein [Geodermatophilus normandii]|uniref:Uncharacterized protein n=1 Tax=Geodermatophilus normandii TaxID=1137989 RepID=A0A6P0GKB0_9ACTN|nr:hypothetical protein [Geodermatophilus normandii]NEM07734.1 hypothetical protein [Geodermatophilus normandii]
MILPEEQLAAVVTALYADADSAGWDTLPLADRTRTYSAWVEDPRVGGIVTRYMTPEAARAWIKDGPMKEYGRARRGAGRYARFGRQGGTTAADVVRFVLGDGTAVVHDSYGDKPFHCLAIDDFGETSYLAWGEARNLRNLLWAALRTAVEDGLPAHIVVMEPPDLTTPGDQVKAHRALAERCRLEIHHMRETLGKTPREVSP